MYSGSIFSVPTGEEFDNLYWIKTEKIIGQPKSMIGTQRWCFKKMAIKGIFIHHVTQKIVICI